MFILSAFAPNRLNICIHFNRYKELNLKSSGMYRKYNNNVPDFLHNRPNGIVQHIMKRAFPKYPSSFVKGCGHRLYMVNSESSNQRYQVWLGSDTQLPSCQCIDYRKNRLPCKHICAVVSLPDVGWQSLRGSFNNHPLFK